MKDSHVVMLLIAIALCINFYADTRQTEAINKLVKVVNSHTEALKVLGESNNRLVERVVPEDERETVTVK